MQGHAVSAFLPSGSPRVSSGFPGELCVDVCFPSSIPCSALSYAHLLCVLPRVGASQTPEAGFVSHNLLLSSTVPGILGA